MRRGVSAVMTTLRVQDNTSVWLAGLSTGWLSVCPFQRAAALSSTSATTLCSRLLYSIAFALTALQLLLFCKKKQKQRPTTNAEWLFGAQPSTYSSAICLLEVEFFLVLFSFLRVITFNFFRFCSTPHFYVCMQRVWSALPLTAYS